MSQPGTRKHLTVKDIARIISFDRSDEGIAKTMRQVRHWTQNDLLRTATQKDTGKGVARVYNDSPTIEVAALLLELSRYGATVSILRPAAEAIYKDFDQYAEMEGWHLQTALTDVSVYVQVAWESDPVTGEFAGAEVFMFDDLEFRDRPSSEGLEKSQRDLLHSATSSVLINLTRILDRIYPHARDVLAK
ncbi:MAG: hypothetical protein ACPGOV_14820 [Magnetovibrionaceae bacterium]